MILVDTSVIVAALRDRTGAQARKLIGIAGSREIVLSRFTELELLVGARDEADWRRLTSYLAGVRLLDPAPTTWREAARLHYELRRQGQTIRSLVDCCIAQIALDEAITLIHDDRDFEAIAAVRPLKQVRC